MDRVEEEPWAEQEWVLAAFRMGPFSTLSPVRDSGSWKRQGDGLGNKRGLLYQFWTYSPRAGSHIQEGTFTSPTLHGQNRLYPLLFLFFPCIARGKGIWGGWVTPNASHPPPRPHSASASLSSPPPSAITQLTVRGLPRGVGTDKGFHGFLVHKAKMPTTAQLAGGGPHKLRRTQRLRNPFRLTSLQSGGAAAQAVYT